MQVKPNELMILTNQKQQFKIFFTPEMEFSCHKGLIKFGKTLHYGELVFTNKNEYFLVVHPNSSDKMFKVNRSTTIVYPKDLGMLIMELGITSESKIVEIGTGSGASTFTLANIVGEKGKIDTIDISSEKQEKGKKNFARHSKFQNTE
jgi:tRNA (adenine57-N1/adenine58-N1)-methyltransferase